MKQFALHGPSVPANALGEREIAEIVVVEAHLKCLRGDDLSAHESHREPVLGVADNELEAVLERMPGLGGEQPMSLQLRGSRPPLGALLIPLVVERAAAVAEPFTSPPESHPLAIETTQRARRASIERCSTLLVLRCPRPA